MLWVYGAKLRDAKTTKLREAHREQMGEVYREQSYKRLSQLGQERDFWSHCVRFYRETS